MCNTTRQHMRRVRLRGKKNNSRLFALNSGLQKQDLREAFRMFDKDKSGYIDGKEILNVTSTLGQALSQDELETFMREADLDGDGKLDYNEFVKMMTKI